MRPRIIGILLLCLAVALLGVAYWNPQGTPGTPVSSSADPAAGSLVAEPDPFQDTAETPGKVREREVRTKLTDGEILGLLSARLPEPVEFPAQTLDERTTAINKLLRKQASPANQIRVIIHTRTENAGARELKLPALEPQENVSGILKKSAEAATIRYRVFEGRVEFIMVG